MEKTQRKSNIGYMALVGTMVNNIVNGDGVCGVHPYLERRADMWTYKPGVHLQAWKFMELFGDDTEYEYLEDWRGDRSVITEVNGVVFYALVDDTDLLENGVLV